MPVTIQGKTFYRTAETCAKVGISQSTLLRWLKKGSLPKIHRDARGWRLFSEEDIKKIETTIWKFDSAE